MNKTTINNSGQPQVELTSLSATYKTELDTLCQDLNAQHSDLEHLLVFIHQKSVARPRVSGILKQAHNRLCQLREIQLDLAGLGDVNPEIAALFAQLGNVLKPGETFSLSAADQALEEAYIKCSADGGKPETLANILAAQALISGAKQELAEAAEFYAKAAAVDGLALPLQWQYESRSARALTDLGRDYRDNTALEQAVELFETTILALTPQKEMPEEWAETQHNLGDALGILGQRHRGTHMLESSIKAYQRALLERDRERLPREWAATQNNLGNALGALGQRQGKTELLEQSIAAFELALLERTEDEFADEWATTQNNLGAALQSLGLRQEGTRMLSKSVAAYNKVVKVWTRKRRPLEWATTLNNLGTVLRTLGDRQSGNRSLEKSVAAYQNALKVRTREQMAQDWAMTQNNLGASLQTLAARTDDTQLLENTVTAYNNALEVWTRETVPMRWIMTMANLGVARRALAERSCDIDIARQAITDLVAVTEYFRDASHAQYRELSEEQLTKARAVVEKLGG